ncbi:hypothetical protein PF005_g2448 [Phytophthora fragariae]|nr:hypothetical protein PF009_g4308 [Phytophthora fragariae]KAE9135603.1 hypothetical protein PF010_g2031 [Phytophthora fragariae]KAE9135911.1 hypothetical protein PF007_g2394 [Phytophthora fragariae]KAE9233183.1 hypothetical protein PF005_g2448 [Phytophthora fragariae]KAE9250799.1 hypothetical protein PF004_g2787 [Phytophthora fragariae]
MSELFGQSMVACVLDNLAGKKINPEVVARLLRGQRIKLYQKLQQGEHVLFHENHKIEPEKGEIKFVYREIWWGRSSIYSQRPVANGADPHGRGQNISGEQFRADALIYDVRSATMYVESMVKLPGPRGTIPRAQNYGSGSLHQASAPLVV